MKIYSIKGMKDYYSEKSYIWSYLFDEIKFTLTSYGFKFINFPILENIFLFNKSFDDSDLFIHKMYSFIDKGSRNIALRPEGTSCCIRFGIENGLLRGQKQKWWYFGPMFRYENPQFCRYREFYQLGIEAFGFDYLNIEIEFFLLISNFFKKINILNNITLEINFLGSLETKNKYSKYLINFFKKNISIFNDNYSLEKIYINPFKILETKNKDILKFINNNLCKLYDFLNIEEKKYSKEILKLLSFFKIPYKLNNFLVRGINYYDSTIFEWKTNILNSQLSICSGGRYNNLTKKLGGINISGIGLAIGWDRLIEFFINNNNLEKNKIIKILITTDNAKYIKHIFLLSENIRNNFFNRLIINSDFSISSINNKINNAIKNNISYIFIIYKISNIKDIILFIDIFNHNKKYIYSINDIINFIQKNILKS